MNFQLDQAERDVVSSMGNQDKIFGGWVRDKISGVEPNDMEPLNELADNELAERLVNKTEELETLNQEIANKAAKLSKISDELVEDCKVRNLLMKEIEQIREYLEQ